MTEQLTLAASIFPLSTLDSRLSTFCPNLFRMTQFRKNASVTPFVSHTFKTKDLKPFRFIHFQKNGGGGYPMIMIAIPKWDSHSCPPTSGRRQHPTAPPISRSPGIKSPA